MKNKQTKTRAKSCKAGLNQKYIHCVFVVSSTAIIKSLCVLEKVVLGSQSVGLVRLIYFVISFSFLHQQIEKFCS